MSVNEEYGDMNIAELANMIERKYGKTIADVKAISDRGDEITGKFLNQLHTTAGDLDFEERRAYAEAMFKHYAANGMGTYKDRSIRLNEFGRMVTALLTKLAKEQQSH